MQIKIKNKNKKTGYTIIETMIAVSLFLIVVTIGMGSLLNANLIHQKSQNMRSIMDSLSFIMEDMSKNLRIGYNYHCILDGEAIPSGEPSSRSCEAGGGGISFKSPSPPVSQWVYYIGATTNGHGIFKSVDDGETAQTVQLTPDEVDIDLASGFLVFGAEPPPDSLQPFITIKLIGNITYKNIRTPFSLQTSISQRLIDI